MKKFYSRNNIKSIIAYDIETAIDQSSSSSSRNPSKGAITQIGWVKYNLKTRTTKTFNYIFKPEIKIIPYKHKRSMMVSKMWNKTTNKPIDKLVNSKFKIGSFDFLKVFLNHMLDKNTIICGYGSYVFDDYWVNWHIQNVAKTIYNNKKKFNSIKDHWIKKVIEIYAINAFTKYLIRTDFDIKNIADLIILKKEIQNHNRSHETKKNFKNISHNQLRNLLGLKELNKVQQHDALYDAKMILQLFLVIVEEIGYHILIENKLNKIDVDLKKLLK